MLSTCCHLSLPSIIATALIVVTSVILSIIGKKYFVSLVAVGKKTILVAESSTSSSTRKKSAICPFSSGSDFIVETADNLPLTPLEVYQNWSRGYNDDPLKRDPIILKPLAAR